MQLFCDHIFCYVPVLNLKLKDDAHQSFSGKKFQTVLVSAAQQRWRTQSTKRVQVKVQKSRVYFMHNFNKLQQLKMSAVWILEISLRILIYNNY